MLKEDFEDCLVALGLNKKEFAALVGVTERTVYGWEKTPHWVDSWILNYAKFKESEKSAILLIKSVGFLRNRLKQRKVSELLCKNWKKIDNYRLYEKPSCNVGIYDGFDADAIFVRKQNTTKEIHFVKIFGSVGRFVCMGEGIRKILLYEEVTSICTVSFDVLVLDSYEPFELEFAKKFFSEILRGVELNIIDAGLLLENAGIECKELERGDKDIAELIYSISREL